MTTTKSKAKAKEKKADKPPRRTSAPPNPRIGESHNLRVVRELSQWHRSTGQLAVAADSKKPKSGGKRKLKSKASAGK